MGIYSKTYLKALGYDTSSIIPSEISGFKAENLYHIECKCRGENPSGDKNRIENTIALTSAEHLEFSNNPKYKYFLYKTHMKFLKDNGVIFDKQYMQQRIKNYKPVTI